MKARARRSESLQSLTCFVLPANSHPKPSREARQRPFNRTFFRALYPAMSTVNLGAAAVSNFEQSGGPKGPRIGDSDGVSIGSQWGVVHARAWRRRPSLPDHLGLLHRLGFAPRLGRVIPVADGTRAKPSDGRALARLPLARQRPGELRAELIHCRRRVRVEAVGGIRRNRECALGPPHRLLGGILGSGSV